MRKPIRRLRHWKQRFNPRVVFICRRRMNWGGVVYEPGDPIPEELAANKTKLRRFWEAHWIELAEFEAPNVATGRVDELPKGVTVTRKGSWYVIHTPDGERKALGRARRDAVLEELRRQGENAAAAA